MTNGTRPESGSGSDSDEDAPPEDSSAPAKADPDSDAAIVVVADASDAGARADVTLARHTAGLSRRAAKQAGLAGRLLVDGRKSPPSTAVVPGMRIAVRADDRAEPPPPIVLDVLHVTQAFVYVAKPPGVHTHRLRPYDLPTLADEVAKEHPECASASVDPREGGAIHRLDHGTSGVVAFARNREAWQRGRDALSNRRVLKVYVAAIAAPMITTPAPLVDAGSVVRFDRTGPELDGVCPGRAQVPGLRLDIPLSGRRRVRPSVSGRDAITEAWNVTPALPSAPLVALVLHTGHRHQARAHLAAIGRPIHGDEPYGGPPGPTLLLHAARLDLSAAIASETPVGCALPPRFF